MAGGAESVIPGSARGTNLWDADPNLQFELAHRVLEKDRKRAELWAREMGRVAGRELDRLAARADANTPLLHQYDPTGKRIDHVEYHAAYRAMEAIAFERFALAAMSHQPGVLGWPTSVPHVVKYLLSYIFGQSEFGLLCPVSMTDATARIVRKFASTPLKQQFLPRLTATSLADLWQGAMFVTEKQAGSDVGNLETSARRDGDAWRLYGEKWFCSNVDADVILTLARPEGAPEGTRGLGLFLIPRLLPSGARNHIFIHRLKDKLGARSIASGEVRFEGAVAHVVGELERGFHQMLEMINVSRLSNAMRAAAIMRRAYLEALLQARGRQAFGGPLLALPLVRQNLTELLVEVEAATAFTLYTAQTLDLADAGDARAARLLRILTPLAKYAVCRRARAVAGDAMDVRGGNGFIEEWPNPRLLRDAHLGSIWEGTSNIVALDVLRAIRRENCAEALLGEIENLLGGCEHPATHDLARQLGVCAQRLAERVAEIMRDAPEGREPLARRLADALYDLASATLLLQEAHWQLADDHSARKLVVARLFAERHLEPHDPLAVREPVPTGEQFEALIDWVPLREGAAEA